MAWYGVRCVVALFGGTVYEERVTLWSASAHDEAIRRAEEEVRDYATDLEGQYTGLAQSFELFDHPGDGAEVFSLMRESTLDRDRYLTRFFDTGAERQREFGGTIE